MKILYTILLFIMVTVLNASPMEGKKKVYLVSSGDELTHIANIVFSKQGDKSSYQIEIEDTPFDDQFLSMRPFQCIMGKKQVMCYVPYPYEAKKTITENELGHLSNDLLFLHKNPSEYGINMWNGIYYKLKQVGQTIEGKVNEIDMNSIASPPDDLNNPFAADEIFEADVGNYVYPKILIK
ncbi:MAG: hypothetical protein A6F71_01150 [Cycloclasticus sp. symbiont of Poecilosclerida sp. M]|nr:MAG: hypothetical protein A6F71_01150 [Cycloclasticus sp. symbiont of Poecilosclerida sp. M]